jgi:hypothetical protein
MGVYHNAAVDNLFASDAEWRAWCLEIQAAILASGFLIAASDTGQIDLTTAVRPAIGTLAGFKMYRANDALQATKPIFVKVEFGVGTSTARGKISISSATSTNGSGTLSGIVSTVNAVMSASADGSGAARVFGGGNEACAWFAHVDGLISSQGSMFYIARSILRVDGTPVGDFVVQGFASSIGATPMSSSQFTNFSAAWASVAVENAAPRPAAAPSTGGDINITYLFDCIYYRAAVIISLPYVIGVSTELPFTDPDASSFTIDVWGASRTFVPIPWTDWGAASTGRGCLPWEA